MGLNIYAYENIKYMEPHEYEKEGDYQFKCAITGEYLSVLWENPHFPGRIEGARAMVPFTFQGSFDFRAGSYGTYGGWRNWLENIVVIEHPEAFAELIHFSDCEGTIGPVVCEKLWRDFARYADEAKYAARHSVEL